MDKSIIMVVEDNQDDLDLTLRAFAKTISSTKSSLRATELKHLTTFSAPESTKAATCTSCPR